MCVRRFSDKPKRIVNLIVPSFLHYAELLYVARIMLIRFLLRNFAHYHSCPSVVLVAEHSMKLIPIMQAFLL